MAGHADRRSSIAPVPAAVLSRRCHGSLDTITDSERRGLRPIGITAHEVAVRTGALLMDLFTLPGVWIFQGYARRPGDVPRIPHVVSAGHVLVLVESVAWPPGRYATTATGQVHCDGVYIGQSVWPLITTVRHWRQALPRGHRVHALVVVHPIADGDLALPAPDRPELGWAAASDAFHDLRACLPRGRRPASATAIAVLAAATTGEQSEQAGDHEPIPAMRSLNSPNCGTACRSSSARTCRAWPAADRGRRPTASGSSSTVNPPHPRRGPGFSSCI